ncbi:trigger factor [Candidatus Falkowbacteria bacterium RIFOXYD2_FULL_35_9]|uniref:Trigger factor n=1 Tax=Candidatus Falkowbacteria bacterium RIFOXYC2_FULL_36_12 TaxID=1798002 RepID=A0A1F5T3V1_9BACT|nr:MAG: trigger factor [Candidatus Falkowbacteria bacterium RIFOXYB2_FULL_35_7]OGF33045.1 MAG: trigger factor [Candidatus Falkowbacteria bacterium RIFOXYA2_FULL_35_8]OGF33406.1 MAG: trigger factor [Candidatus Falkowbacteria bacterium RIFOXYC2_FULL_36_12]OGF46540.1 MAG: trigger factor [Candidatus Falkowbacteria bacterium RIFOXYD2_FULL_35_9]
MKITKNLLEKSQVELTIEISQEDLKPYLEKAAIELTEKKPLQGFRPGKAPYEIVRKQLGEMVILQQASNAIIGETFYQAIEKEKLETVDQPNISIVKMAPENPFIYKATVSLLPEIKLVDFTTIKIKKSAEIKITDDDVNKVIKDLQNMRATEVNVDREVKKDDKVEVNFETFIDGVALAGGKAEKYPLVIGAGQMIPGFEEKVIGMKKDEEKQFEISFPKDYHQTKIAGKKAKFKIKLLQVFERQLPELNDDFAKNLGVKTVIDLQNQIKHNLEHENQHKQEHGQDMDIVNAIIDKSEFGQLPEVLITDEARKMMEELKDNVAHQGLGFEDYLNHLKKKESDLLLDFTPDAIKRVKTALAIRQMAKDKNISATKDEIQQEKEITLASYKMNPAYAQHMAQLEQNMKSESAERYFGNVITNRKVMDMLRETMIEGYAKHSCEHEEGHDHGHSDDGKDGGK